MSFKYKIGIKKFILFILNIIILQSCSEILDIDSGDPQYKTTIKEQNLETGEIIDVIEMEVCHPYCNYLNNGQIVVTDLGCLYLFEGNKQKYVVDISPVSILFNFFSVSPNAPIIYFMGTESILTSNPSPNNIYSFDFSTNTLKRLTNCSDNEYPKYPEPSNDGEKITFVMHWSYLYKSPDGNDSISEARQDNFAIKSMSKDGSNQEEIVFIEDYTNYSLFGPNDNAIYYATQSSEIHKYDLLNGTSEIIIPNLHLLSSSEVLDFCQYRMFSINENYLVYSTSSDYGYIPKNSIINLYNLETGEISELTQGLKPLVFKGEDKILYRENVDYFVSDATNFKIIDFDGNIIQSLDKGQRVYLSPDKNKILYTFYEYLWD